VNVDRRARELIDRLGLEPHPEGGYYRQLYCSATRVVPDDGRDARAAMTTIFFLLTEGGQSRWHRVLSDEIWHFYEGDPLELLIAPPELDRVERVSLGGWDGVRQPVRAVPAGWWQAARPQGRYALVGCSVAPGFEFIDFAFLRDRHGADEAVRRLGADLTAML
jgi:predicted cupin superfamily sugar epimerase